MAFVDPPPKPFYRLPGKCPICHSELVVQTFERGVDRQVIRTMRGPVGYHDVKESMTIGSVCRRGCRVTIETDDTDALQAVPAKPREPAVPAKPLIDERARAVLQEKATRAGTALKEAVGNDDEEEP